MDQPFMISAEMPLRPTQYQRKPLFLLVPLMRFERTTYGLGIRHSIQLSYKCMIFLPCQVPYEVPYIKKNGPQPKL